MSEDLRNLEAGQCLVFPKRTSYSLKIPFEIIEVTDDEYVLREVSGKMEKRIVDRQRKLGFASRWRVVQWNWHHTR
jgi:hypothetical protein